DPNQHLVEGNYLVRFEARTLDDIRALGVNSEDDDRKFATAARLSDINLGLYRTLLQPWVRMWANEGVAEWMRRMHPARLQYEIFCRHNPFMRALEPMVPLAREHRRQAAQDNAFLQAQRWFSDLMEASLNGFRDMRDHGWETMFHAVYGSPVLQALV